MLKSAMRHSVRGISALLFACALVACGSSSPVSSSAQNATPRVEPVTRYDMANACYALQSVTDKTYARRAANGNYVLAAAVRTDADPFFMKPSALGKYLLYADDESLLAVRSDAGGSDSVTSVSKPAEVADWTVDTTSDGSFTLYSASADRYLTTDPNDATLVLASDQGLAGKFRFVPASGCEAFPEIGLDAIGTTYKGQGIDKPVLGFADVHSHMSATTFLGGAHYGAPFSRFGVTEAMGNCAAQHGPNGTLDLVGNLLGPNGSPLGAHDTQGWPTFVDWPRRDALTHEAMYYRWIQRAWLAGLRLMVNNVVENEVLCRLESAAIAANDLGHDLSSVVPDLSKLPNPAACNEMESAVGQIQFMRDMQDYIDAQEGGPGKGWFRIVETPAEARKVINDGKMAVVLGIEISHLFNCSVKQPGGLAEIDGCDKDEIDTQLDRLHDLGVRQMFPVHEFDNGFGGNGIFDGFVLNVGNFVDTGKFWDTYDCPQDDYFFGPGAHMKTSIPGPANPLTDLLTNATAGILPLYRDTLQCNKRTLTDLGRYAIGKMMEKKIIIEVDHLELKMKSELLDIAEQQTPVYPLVSSHGGHGGISMTQAHRLLADGGYLYPSKGNGRQFVDDLDKLRPLADDRYLFAMGYGADTNGLATQSGPRGADAVPVKYPFTLFKGKDWPSEFARIQPITFDESAVPEGHRAFDINSEGLAQYGMIADWVEAVRIEGGEPALRDLYNSAELYLQVWERTLAR
ncbi:MAG TPA: hypothetical protein VIR56_13215 [Solimonas sp.]